jgi:transposase-like protein
MSISAVARKYGIHPNQLFRWIKLVQEGVFTAVRAGEKWFLFLR